MIFGMPSRWLSSDIGSAQRSLPFVIGSGMISSRVTHCTEPNLTPSQYLYMSHLIN